MREFFQKLTELVDVKSITTLAFVLCFVVLSLCRVITTQDFMTTFLIVITYYFSKKEKGGD